MSGNSGKGSARLKPTVKERSYVKQTDIPRLPLSEAMKVAEALRDNFAGRSAAPHQLAMALDISPTSSYWREITGAALGYGITNGGWSANSIELTQLGKRIVTPTEEGQDLPAKVEAAMSPSVSRKFFQRYNRAKLPQDNIAKNVLVEMGVPQERAEKVLEILKGNGGFVGIIQQTKTGPFVAVDTAATPAASDETTTESRKVEQRLPENGAARMDLGKTQDAATPVTSTDPQRANHNVFIAHGKNKEIVTQLKDLLTFGKFTPIVAEEHETAAKPVPEKVLDEMRRCFAGVIHVAGEENLLDQAGTVHYKLNENVLIEIGAAMALYQKNLILLVQKEIHLPSNLQGLYVCQYEGQKLDYEATMKLLKAFSEFR